MGNFSERLATAIPRVEHKKYAWIPIEHIQAVVDKNRELKRQLSLCRRRELWWRQKCWELEHPESSEDEPGYPGPASLSASREINRRCVGCGAEYDSNTLGCGVCSERHRRRRSSGHRAVRTCRGCGCHLDDDTTGCRTCRQRHRIPRGTREEAA